MESLDRRGFGKQTLASLLTYSLLETLLTGDLLAKEVRPVAAQWLKQLDELSRDLRGRELNQVEWQEQIEALFDQVDLPELLKFVEFDDLKKNVQFRDRGERSLRRKFPKVEGLPSELVFGHQFFALKKDRSVVPHGHNNMATAFYVLEGEFHGRHYDRIEDETDHVIVKPTIDRTFKPAETSTISDHKDNVHWFKATSDTGFIFNIHVLNVVKDGPKTGRVYIDPNGEKLADGTVRDRRIKSSEAYKLYG